MPIVIDSENDLELKNLSDRKTAYASTLKALEVGLFHGSDSVVLSALVQFHQGELERATAAIDTYLEQFKTTKESTRDQSSRASNA